MGPSLWESVPMRCGGRRASTASWFSHWVSIWERVLDVRARLIALQDVPVQKKPYGTPCGMQGISFGYAIFHCSFPKPDLQITPHRLNL